MLFNYKNYTGMEIFFIMQLLETAKKKKTTFLELQAVQVNCF